VGEEAEVVGLLSLGRKRPAEHSGMVEMAVAKLDPIYGAD
jgi:hypothetical protein